jgi:glycosyltransferase involved in cell wall biosynthesis
MLTTLHNNLTKDAEYIWSNYDGWYNTISTTQYRSLPRLPRASYAGVVHNGIDVESFPFSPDKSDYALFLGRMAPAKAPHLAIEAAQRAGVRLIMAGKIALPEEREYFDAVIRPRLDCGRVEFVGEADGCSNESFTATRAACWCANPVGRTLRAGDDRGAGLRTPAIAFRRGAAPELIDDRSTGFLVSDATEMADAIARLDSIDPHVSRRRVEHCLAPPRWPTTTWPFTGGSWPAAQGWRRCVALRRRRVPGRGTWRSWLAARWARTTRLSRSR